MMGALHQISSRIWTEPPASAIGRVPICNDVQQALDCDLPGNRDDVHRWLTAALPADMGKAIAADVVQGGREVCVCGRRAQACVACAI